jgi:hypothetical protein
VVVARTTPRLTRSKRAAFAAAAVALGLLAAELLAFLGSGLIADENGRIVRADEAFW